MENKIYYGEYSLKHWIDLMLSKKVELPSINEFLGGMKSKFWLYLVH